MKRSTHVPNRILAVTALLLAPLGFLVAGCNCPDCPDPAPATLGAASADPTVTLVTIDENRHTSPTDPEPMIAPGGGGIQWYNAGSGTVTVTLTHSPISLELLPGAYSMVHRTNANVTAGASIGYTVDPAPEDAPDPPSFGVGP